MSENFEHPTEKIKFLGIPIGKKVHMPFSVKTYLFGIRIKKKQIGYPEERGKKNQKASDFDKKTQARIIKINYSISKILFNNNLIKLKNKEKIRLHFLYIADSYWPSWQSLIEACQKDPRIELKMVFLNTAGTRLYSSQYELAEQFLKENNISYIDYKDYFPEDEKPHVLFYQTPYDTNYSVFRKVRPDFVTEQGIRIAYLSYGIEYDMSVNNDRLQNLQYDHLVHKLAWKIFVMHKDIKEGFYMNCKTGGAHVHVTGHPKFDWYINKYSELPANLIAKANGRKIIALQLHCYNDNDCPGAKRIHSVPFSEHLKILELLKNYKEYFFVYTIHPAYKTRNIDKKFCSLKDYSYFISEIENSENTYLYQGNHQPLIANADAFITENSSLMIEMGFFNKSVLYMYDVPIAKKPFAEKLSDTFHHGHTWRDVLDFLDNTVFKNDELLDLRERYRDEIFPKEVYDGKIGLRIKEYIIEQLKNE